MSDNDSARQQHAVGSACLARAVRAIALTRRDEIAVAAAVAVGVAATILVGTTARWRYGPSAGWIAAAAVYLIWTWARTSRFSAGAVERIIQQRGPGHGLADTVVVLASIASLGGVGYLLAATNVKGPDTAIAAAIGFSSVTASWLVVHTVYTLRYAMHYYSEPVGGIDFNQDEKPTVADFAYMAFTIAMTYGVTDTPLKSRAVRVTALQQALLSYLFGTVILALTVQVIGSLNSL